jgi:hypothetical protein
MLCLGKFARVLLHEVRGEGCTPAGEQDWSTRGIARKRGLTASVLEPVCDFQCCILRGKRWDETALSA